MKKELIDIISKSYLTSKRKLRENELGITYKDNKRLNCYRLNVYHIEYVVSCLNENDKFIINNEVLQGKKGNWYYDQMSTATYYRHRNKAYDNFLRDLKQ